MMLYLARSVLFLILIPVIVPARAQSDGELVRTIAFYNVENLFDTINQNGPFDIDYTPEGRNRYSSFDYGQKIDALGKVIPRIGRDQKVESPVIIGLAEVENLNVLQDLVNNENMLVGSYSIIHEDSPDLRGIDVALLYDRENFFPIEYEYLEVRLWNEKGERLHTRDVLWVHGLLDGDEIHLLVNHWPSRRGGASRSASKRLKAAWVNRTRIDQILNQNPKSKIIVMGDFNDDPIDASMRNGLGSEYKSSLSNGALLNPMEPMYKKGWNTLVFRDQVHIFDQILISEGLVTLPESMGYRFYKAGIFNPKQLVTQEGKYKGYPFRSFDNGKYSGGFSDHFPVYIQLIKSR